MITRKLAVAVLVVVLGIVSVVMERDVTLWLVITYPKVDVSPGTNIFAIQKMGRLRQHHYISKGYKSDDDER